MSKPILSLHARLSNFVDWIAPNPTTRDEIKTRADNVRRAIRAKAEADKLTIQSTPLSGSFATKTGLRRHMRGASEVEGQDVDLPFVVSPKTKDEEQLSVLLPRFERYAAQAYPDTERETTKSSVRLKFADKVNFDIVPMFSTVDPEYQILVRQDGERRETSVRQHVAFIRSRNDKSNVIPGRVKFNEMVRLLKWWRCFRQDGARTITEIPSFLMNLLAAHAFDTQQLGDKYGESVADWFGFSARVVRNRSSIVFHPSGSIGSSTWMVQDPVNANNNAADKWSGVMCDELADWLEESRDQMYEAIVSFTDRRETDGMNALARVFGSPILHHSESKP